MRIEFGFGIGEDRNGNKILPVNAAGCLLAIVRKASELFGGCNLIRGEGAWVDPKGKLIVEPSATLIVDSQPVHELDANVSELTQFIGQELNQTAVHVVWIGNQASNVIIDYPDTRADLAEIGGG